MTEKYIIELEPLLMNNNGKVTMWKAVNFNTLVFDDNGIKKLQRYEDPNVVCADAIEVLDMKLQGANAAIAGMQREIERMVIDSANIKPQWIPVAARLPEKDIEVLVFAEGKIEGFFGDTAIAISKRYDFKIFTDSEGVEVWQSPWQYFLTDYEITHWMPLPEQPGQKEEN